MAMKTELALMYNRDSDILMAVVPKHKDTPSTAILPFSQEVGIPASSFIVYVGIDPETEEITGEFTGFEMPFFKETFPHIKESILVRFNTAIPAIVMGPQALRFDPSLVNFSYIDEDILPEKDTVAIFASLYNVLSDVFKDVSDPRSVIAKKCISTPKVSANLAVC